MYGGLHCVHGDSIIPVVVVLRSPIHANEPSEYNGMLYRTSNRVLNNGIKVIILICMDGTSQYHHHHNCCKVTTNVINSYQCWDQWTINLINVPNAMDRHQCCQRRGLPAQLGYFEIACRGSKNCWAGDLKLGYFSFVCPR